MTGDTWEPTQYERFHAERTAPFDDLLALVRSRPGARVVDLGCGTGELTVRVHRHVGAAETVGIDSSAAMLERSEAFAGSVVRFELGDIAAFAPARPYDVVFSNAALQWLDDHEALLARLTGALAPGGQLAVQMPANHDHPSHLVAEELAGEAPFREALGGYVRRSPVLDPEAYARLLDRLGYAEQHVRLQVYVHHLPAAADVVEWVKGTLLTDYRRRLPPALYERFLEGYRERLLPRLGDARPYFYPFKRILFWARR